jgi:hypothetical protein
MALGEVARPLSRGSPHNRMASHNGFCGTSGMGLMGRLANFGLNFQTCYRPSLQPCLKH